MKLADMFNRITIRRITRWERGCLYGEQTFRISTYSPSRHFDGEHLLWKSIKYSRRYTAKQLVEIGVGHLEHGSLHRTLVKADQLPGRVANFFKARGFKL